MQSLETPRLAIDDFPVTGCRQVPLSLLVMRLALVQQLGDGWTRRGHVVVTYSASAWVVA
jgi:hypothetical protein